MLIFFSIIIAIVLVFSVLDGSFLKRKYKRVWNSAYSRALHSIQEKILAGALTASSSHNLQPWLIKITNDSAIELYADMDKELHVIDPENDQLLISQGTFIEQYKKYAALYGYETTVDYADFQIKDGVMKIADMQIEKEFERKEVDIITSASHNYAEYEESSNIDRELESLSEKYDNLDYEMISVKDDSQIQSWLRKAYAIESSDEAAMKELLENFRFTEWEKTEYRYGLSLNTLPSILMPFLQPIVKMSASNWESFGQSSIKTFEDRLKKEFAYILLKADKPDELDYVKIGEFYQALTTEIKGYSLRPSVQLLEDFPAMATSKRAFKEKYSPDSELMLIIGIKKSEPINNPPIRHLVEDILIH